MQRFAASPIRRCASRSPTLPRWTHYVIGVAVVLVRHGVIEPPRARLTVTSDVPQFGGRVVQRCARSGDRACARRRRSRAAASRGAVPGSREPGGRRARAGSWTRSSSPWVAPARCLPILCRPASVDPVVDAARRPRGGRRADRRRARRERRALPPSARGRVHGQAHRRGRARDTARLGERAAGRRSRRRFPKRSTARRSSTAGARPTTRVTTVDPAETYPVRAATTFGVEEHRRSDDGAGRASARRDVDALGPLMAASHAGYDAMGLGHPAATAAVEECSPARACTAPARAAAGPAAPWSCCASAAPLDDLPDLVR